MYATVSSAVALLALTGAAPAFAQLSQAKGFQLQVQLKDSTKDLDPPVAGQQLTGARAGAGLNVAVVAAVNPSQPGYPFYLNGTSDLGLTDILNDYGTDFSWGLIIQDQATSDPAFPGEHSVSINTGGGTNGVGFAGTESYVSLIGPAPGAFAVCQRSIQYVGDNLNVVRYVYEDESLPEGCVSVDFEPICAELNELPANADASHEFAQDVQCVAA